MTLLNVPQPATEGNPPDLGGRRPDGGDRELGPEAIKARTDLVALIGADSHNLRRVAATNGGEWAGACPFCGDGDDRLRVQPERGRWWCRKCSPDERWADAIEYVQRRHSVDFREALRILGGGIAPSAPAPRINGHAPKAQPPPAPSEPRKAPPGASAEYVYCDPSTMEVLGKKLRYPEPGTDSHGKPRKRFVWVTPDGCVSQGGIKPADLPPYNAGALATFRRALVWITEGEGACDAAADGGVCAVTNAGGAGQTDYDHFAPHLADRDVALWPDNDNAGRKWADALGAKLAGIARSVRIVTVPDLPEAGDAVDYFRAGRTVEELERLHHATEALEAPDATKDSPSPGEAGFSSFSSTRRDFPEGAPDPEEDDAGASIRKVPPLPEYARLGAEVGKPARVWLDSYIQMGVAQSPRTPAAFHEAAALFAICATIARRAGVEAGPKHHYPSLNAVCVARSTLYSKTGAFDVLRPVLKAAGFNDLLLASRFTPQALTADLALKVPAEVAEGSAEAQAAWLQRHHHGAQRAIIRDEVAGLFDDCNRDYNSGLLPLLLSLADSPDTVDPDLTLSRGLVQLENVGISLIGATTPAALRLHASKPYHWLNGLFGRFALIGPQREPEWAFWGDGRQSYDSTVIEPLKRLYTALPDVTAEYLYLPNEKGEGQRIVGARQVNYASLTVKMDDAAWAAYRNYDRALYSALQVEGVSDRLDATYGRLPGIAFHLAIALAVMGWANAPQPATTPLTLRLPHWAAAQEVVERWRHDAHSILSDALADEAAERREGLVSKLIARLRAAEGQREQRNVTQKFLHLDAEELSAVVRASGGRVAEWAEKTGGRPAKWVGLPEAATKATKVPPQVQKGQTLVARSATKPAREAA